MTILKYNWTKYGIIWKPLNISSETYSHATAPTPIKLDDSLIRVFYTSLDSSGVGRVFWVDVDSTNPTKIIAFSETPVLDIGMPGMFDDNGVMALSVIRSHTGNLYMYYAGFEICEKIRYRILTGLAISADDGKSFTRYSETPVLERSDGENFFRCGTHVIYENEMYKMWYVAGNSWIELQNRKFPVYNIRYSESMDGINWPRLGSIVLETDNTSHGYGRPWIIQNRNNNLEMFYSIRNPKTSKYSFGLARKQLEDYWQRMDSDSGFDVGESEFTRDAIMYGSFIEQNGKLYCFYNGDEFGREGFALAEVSID